MAYVYSYSGKVEASRFFVINQKYIIMYLSARYLGHSYIQFHTLYPLFWNGEAADDLSYSPYDNVTFQIFYDITQIALSVSLKRKLRAGLISSGSRPPCIEEFTQDKLGMHREMTYQLAIV